MIKKILHKNLEKCFLKIGFKENKGGELAINEWNFVDSNITIMHNFNQVTFKIETLFKRNDFENKVLNKSSFLNNLEQYFLVDNIIAEETLNKRIKAIFELTQATCEV